MKKYRLYFIVLILIVILVFFLCNKLVFKTTHQINDNEYSFGDETAYLLNASVVNFSSVLAASKNVQTAIDEVYDENLNPIGVARHPEEIIKLKGGNISGNRNYFKWAILGLFVGTFITVGIYVFIYILSWWLMGIPR